MISWAESDDKGYPRCVDDVDCEGFAEALLHHVEELHLDSCVDTAFAGSIEEDAEIQLEQSQIPIDAPGDVDLQQTPADVLQEHDLEQEMLDQLPLPGNPRTEAERRRKWLALPRRARIAIRRMHRNLRHTPREGLIQMLRAARSPREYIDAAKAYRGNACESTQRRHVTHKVSPPKPYEFNREVGVDALEIKDAAGSRFDILNAVDQGTTFDQGWIVREGVHQGPPSSKACLKAFDSGWVRWAGWPRYLSADRGVHNRGCFGRTMLQREYGYAPQVSNHQSKSDVPSVAEEH